MRIAACLLIPVLAACGFAGRESDRAPELTGVGSQPQFAHRPASSCSAAACHGGGQPGRIGSEHSTWAPDLTGATGDPHARAYRVLFNPDSVRIGKLVGGGPAHENILCLKCHAPAGVADRTARAEGVGCTACHGPAEKWLTVHYLPEWKAKSDHAKWADYGFIPTKNLTARIANCATCHVGSADGEVNHDLIAAGHPRLAFEYTRFHFSPGYRKHWVERMPQPEFEARAWVIGQAASARAAVEVLHHRAKRAEKNESPWPEFAGYSCFACHQSVGETPSGTTGSPPWEPWYAASVDVAAGKRLVKFAALRALMAQANPKHAVVEQHSAAALAELDAWLADLQSGESTLRVDTRRTVQALALAAKDDSDWDSLASRYLGCAAMLHAGPRAAATPLLPELRQHLAFPRGFNNPGEFTKRRDAIRDVFLRIERETNR